MIVSRSYGSAVTSARKVLSLVVLFVVVALTFKLADVFVFEGMRQKAKRNKEMRRQEVTLAVIGEAALLYAQETGQPPAHIDDLYRAGYLAKSRTENRPLITCTRPFCKWTEPDHIDSVRITFPIDAGKYELQDDVVVPGTNGEEPVIVSMARSLIPEESIRRINRSLAKRWLAWEATRSNDEE